MEDERIKGFDVCFLEREREREREREKELLYKIALGPQLLLLFYLGFKGFLYFSL